MLAKGNCTFSVLYEMSLSNSSTPRSGFILSGWNMSAADSCREKPMICWLEPKAALPPAIRDKVM